MTIDQFVERMMELYPRIARAIAAHESDYLSQGKITLPQFWTLDYLHCHGQSTMTEISRFLRISRAATTGLIDRLLIQGLILRGKESGDRRLVRIDLTAKGHRIIKHIREQKHKNLTHVFTRISATDRSEHLRILEQIAKTGSSQGS